LMSGSIPSGFLTYLTFLGLLPAFALFCGLGMFCAPEALVLSSDLSCDCYL
jgi:hypothetical protein